MKRKICFIFELLLKIATIIFAFWGVCLQARDDGGFIRSNTYLYFTIISNLETVIIFSVFVVLRIVENIKGKQIIPKPLFMFKFMITAAMTITVSEVDSPLATHHVRNRPTFASEEGWAWEYGEGESR